MESIKEVLVKFFSNPIAVVITISIVVFIIQNIRISSAEAKAGKRIRELEEEKEKKLAQATEIRDESYVKLNDENRNLKKEIEELKVEKMNLMAHINGLNQAEKDKKELYIYNLAIDKIKKDPRTGVVFMSIWPSFYNEAVKEYEESTIGKKIFNFITLKHLRNTNRNIETKNVELIEEKEV